MDKTLVRIVELKVISVIILLIVGGLAGFLLWESPNNTGALYGGFACLATCLLMALFLFLLSVVKEHYESVIINERRSSQSTITSLKGVITAMTKTARTHEANLQRQSTEISGKTQETPFEGYEIDRSHTSTTG